MGACCARARLPPVALALTVYRVRFAAPTGTRTQADDVIGQVATSARERLLVHGVVQGVGFRPFVHSLATDLGLSGWIGNDSAGVVVEVEGPPMALAEFHRRLAHDKPRLAVIDAVTTEMLPLR